VTGGCPLPSPAAAALRSCLERQSNTTTARTGNRDATRAPVWTAMRAAVRCLASVLWPGRKPAVPRRRSPFLPHHSCVMGHASDHIRHVPRTFHAPCALAFACSTDAACTSTGNSPQRHHGFPQRATEDQSDNKQAQEAGEKKR
jgi:hypothetical protein